MAEPTEILHFAKAYQPLMYNQQMSSMSNIPTKGLYQPSNVRSGSILHNKNISALSYYLFVVQDTSHLPPREAIQPSSHAQRIEKATNAAMGYGVFTLAAIRENTVVGEYMGKLVPLDETRTSLEESLYMFGLKTSAKVDARCYGDLTRFVNHHCHPNLDVERFTPDEHLKGSWTVTNSAESGGIIDSEDSATLSDLKPGSQAVPVPERHTHSQFQVNVPMKTDKPAATKFASSTLTITTNLSLKSHKNHFPSSSLITSTHLSTNYLVHSFPTIKVYPSSEQRLIKIMAGLNRPILNIFMGFPAEVRLQIFEKAFDGSRARIIAIHPSPPTNKSLTLRPTHHYQLLLTCREIYNEARHSYWSSTTIESALNSSFEAHDLSQVLDTIPRFARPLIQEIQCKGFQQSPGLGYRQFLGHFTKLETLILEPSFTYLSHQEYDQATWSADSIIEQAQKRSGVKLSGSNLDRPRELKILQRIRISVMLQSRGLTIRMPPSSARFPAKVFFINHSTGEVAEGDIDMSDEEGFQKVL
ncbi:hypothetical protein J7T55_004980 [Diaporthe amygdali]|uniref:uncharacterized protein n=1 Tax=Phomopsis amygdali TaxID=1214568 RepID=UPI0022FF105A|nr:uncharacterized protein J7T55_004980 [Diaporthe amygdali]KAJ0116035.1 hypothetical protein J7T55_004980 [Diaporthe amygdali]